MRPHLTRKKKLGMEACTCHASYEEIHKIGLLHCLAQPGEKWDPISKITRTKRIGGMARVIEHLPSKCEALSSNPSMAKIYLSLLLKTGSQVNTGT
jgi:hypothetical protein